MLWYDPFGLGIWWWVIIFVTSCATSSWEITRALWTWIGTLVIIFMVFLCAVTGIALAGRATIHMSWNHYGINCSCGGENFPIQIKPSE